MLKTIKLSNIFLLNITNTFKPKDLSYIITL